MRLAKKYITPIDMEIIYRAYKLVITELNQAKPAANSREVRELSDKVTRKLVSGCARRRH